MSTGLRVGVIGLGNIGGAVAGNLIADGHHVSVLDADPVRMGAVVGLGGRKANTPQDVGERSEITFASLPTPEIVDGVASAWLEGAPADTVFVDLSTNAPAMVRAIGARLEAAGRHFLECPLTGGAPGAQARMLVFMAGGDAAVFERVKPLLDKLGRATFHVGPLGFGNTAKLVNSVLAFTSTWVSLEALAVAAKTGLDLRTMVDVVRTGGATNFYIDRMVELMNERGRPTQFALSLAAKDAGLFLDVAREHGVPTPAAAQVAQALVAAVGAGLGDKDFTDLVELVERNAGLELRLPPPRS
jgi:3-hydroxyisobutyrate dehydrogenase-like beta-hydroxyacid dehydrogenase